MHSALRSNAPLTLLQIDIILEVTYALSMGLLKCSICLMLYKIFPLRGVRYAALTALGLSICWSVMTILIGFLICTPLSYNWDTTIPGGHCGNQNAAYSAVSAIDIGIDVLIFVVPLPHIWKLHVQTVTKVALSFLFGLGLLYVPPLWLVYQTIISKRC